MAILVFASEGYADNVQYQSATGEVTSITAASIPTVSGYSVLINPVIPSLVGCDQPPPSALQFVAGALAVRASWACFEGQYVHSRQTVIQVVEQELDAAFVIFEASQPAERLFRAVQTACPVTDVSAPCIALRGRASSLRSGAQTLVNTQGW